MNKKLVKSKKLISGKTSGKKISKSSGLPMGNQSKQVWKKSRDKFVWTRNPRLSINIYSLGDGSYGADIWMDKDKRYETFTSIGVEYGKANIVYEVEELIEKYGNRDMIEVFKERYYQEYRQKWEDETMTTLDNKLSERWKTVGPWNYGVFWDETAKNSWKEYKEMKIYDRKGTEVTIMFREEPEFIEVFSIDARPTGTGFGSQVVEEIKHYAWRKEKGYIATKVENEAWAKKNGLTRRDPIVDGRPLSEITGYAEWVYGDVPENAIDYSWITEE